MPLDCCAAQAGTRTIFMLVHPHTTNLRACLAALSSTCPSSTDRVGHTAVTLPLSAKYKFYMIVHVPITIGQKCLSLHHCMAGHGQSSHQQRLCAAHYHPATCIRYLHVPLPISAIYPYTMAKLRDLCSSKTCQRTSAAVA